MQPSLFTLADAGLGPVFFAVSGALFAAFLVLIVLAEAIVLRVMRYSGFGRSLLDAFVANIVSSLFGIVVVLAGASQETLLASIAGWVGAYAVSVAIEAGMLMLFKRQPKRRIWVLSLVANAVSYVFLIAFYFAATN